MLRFTSDFCCRLSATGEPSHSLQDPATRGPPRLLVGIVAGYRLAHGCARPRRAGGHSVDHVKQRRPGALARGRRKLARAVLIRTARPLQRPV